MTSGWQTRRLADFAVTVSTGPFGSVLHKSDYVNDGVPLVNPINIVGECIVPDTSKLIGTETKLRLSNYVLSEGDVVVGRRGEIGRCAVIGPSENGWVCGTGSFFIRPSKALDVRFLAHLIRSDGYRDKLEQLSTGTTMKNLSNSVLAELPISVPPLSEQRRIVGILDEAFAGMATAKANAEKNLQNARALFESHLQSVFTRRGGGWVEKQLSEICDIKHGFAFDGADFSEGVPEGHPFVITPGNFTENGKLLFNGKNSKRFSGSPPSGFQFEIGDLVVVMTDLSSKMKILGKPAFVETNDVLHNQRIGRVIFLNDLIEKRLLYYFMMTGDFLKNIKASATGTMVKHTAPKRILSNVIPYPKDRNQQVAIISKLDDVQVETQRLESIYQQKLAALEALKKSLLHRAFTGKL